jgi:hypothetical protein
MHTRKICKNKKESRTDTIKPNTVVDHPKIFHLKQIFVIPPMQDKKSASKNPKAADFAC